MAKVWIAITQDGIIAVYATRKKAKTAFTDWEEYVWKDDELYSEAYAPNGLLCEVERFEVES